MIDVEKSYDSEGRLVSISYHAMDVNGSQVSLSKATVDELIHAYSKEIVQEIEASTSEVSRKVAKVDTEVANMDSAEPLFKNRSNVIKNVMRQHNGLVKKLMKDSHKERLKLIKEAYDRSQKTGN